uniref:Dynamin-type G domain-containing protein n=2 Tax=Panagrolaimus sp. ES5 TaxID=591445 RepID=A0AC34FYX3_9BILA
MNASGDNQSQSRKTSRYEEPLKRFTDAKNQMKDIYNDLEGCVQNLAQFYDGGSDANKFVPEKEIQEVKRFQDSISTIQKMFNRDKMKVVFFGRTSNGKSTVINAMLHQKLLPQGIGHTTSSFLK